MDELVEGVLTIGSGLTPEDRSCLVIHLGSLEGNVLAVALHRQLLEISGKTLQVLLVGKNSDRLRAEKIIVPDAQKSHQDGQVAVEWSGAKMFVHLVEAI